MENSRGEDEQFVTLSHVESSLALEAAVFRAAQSAAVPDGAVLKISIWKCALAPSL
jgi:hypothetical protein